MSSPGEARSRGRFTLPPEARGQRLDHALRDALVASGREVSVREVRRALDAGRVLVDGRRRAPGRRAEGGEGVDASSFVARSEARLEPDPGLARAVGVLSTWPDLVALDKPSGLPTAPVDPHDRATLVHAACALFPEIASAGDGLEGGLLHRLDTGTSGVVLLARTPAARSAGRAWFAAHRVEKTYLALCSAAELPAELDLPIRPGASPDRVGVGPGRGALPARATFERLSFEPVTRDGEARMLVRVRTRFGRRHQVRAHLAHLGAPLVGDAIYGGPAGPRLMLHAESVRLPDDRAAQAPAPEGFS